MRVELDQILDLADKHGVPIESLQETKFKEHYFLKVHHCSVYRMGRPSGSGGGLVLIRNLNFRKIVFPVQDSNLELEGIFVVWKKKSIDIFSMHHHLIRKCSSEFPRIDKQKHHFSWRYQC
ncbi:hypothetical protein TNCT_54501 [Trichonephila clavata]|uniref:Uncharacterized protein n=1 Tax=Trichonephila clavata TaxID=2740835 RepID=A0A8X6LBC4_TRICU|nr:hypothetical protein TNCT_54501 [Trichonephila clavata]